jgi:nicotinate phosphoribosyltransferase
VSRERTLAGLRSLDPAHKRLLDPHEYPAGLEIRLHELWQTLIQQMSRKFPG